MTHFACADDDPIVTRQQLDIFNETTQGLPGKVSVCNSAATLTPGLWAQVPMAPDQERSEEHTSELQSLMRITYAVFCLKKKKNRKQKTERYLDIYTDTTSR